MNTLNIEKKTVRIEKKLAEKHWVWLESLLHKVYVDAFEHGYKHGMNDKVGVKGK